MYVHQFMLLFQTESGFSKKRCSDVQDWGHVCSFQGKNCGGFGAFTTWEVEAAQKETIACEGQTACPSHAMVSFLKVGSVHVCKTEPFQTGSSKNLTHILELRQVW